MPDNEQSAAYYARAIEAVLAKSNRRESITMATEADLKTGAMTAIFRPVHLPLVSDVRFEGNQRITSADLTAAVARVLPGKGYTELIARRILDQNLRPLYEEKACLTLKFPAVKIAEGGDGKVAVTAVVDEGPVWTLGKVDVLGDDLPLEAMRKAANFPEGQPANWRLVTTEMAAMEKVLRQDGYLRVSSRAERAFRKDATVVDVAIRVNKGKQFRFGALALNGLSAGVERECRAMWQLREGEPMNGLYMDDFLRAILRGPAKGVKSVKQELRVRAGTNVIDPVVTFK